MAVTYTYPVSRELMQIAPAKIARLTPTRVGLQILPIRGINAAFLEWEQKDNYSGLQKLRGYGGSPTRVNPIGQKRYRVEPAVYGEFISHEEQELTQRAGSAVGDIIVDISDLITGDQDQLLQRELDRIEQLIWLLLTSGTFAVNQPRGDGTSVVVYTDTFVTQTITAATPFSTTATATPLRVFRQMKILGRGKGVTFGRKAKAYLNETTLTNILNNTNPDDLGSKLSQAIFPDIADTNKVLMAQDLPELVVYDEGYYDDNNAFQLYIPDGKIVVIGAHQTNSKIGEYLKTINAYANRQPTSYSLVKNYMTGENAPVEIGKGIETHQGHNGGPVLYYPGAIVVLNV